jgi:TolB-like protein/lipopolysaccharide biosynthesis regulator YciM
MEYLGDALTEGLIASLSHIPNLKVIALASVLRYKGQEVDPPAVGRELSVNAVLSGRIIQQGDSLSISVELIDARHGTHLWDKQYDRKLTDLLSAQQDIAREILVRLRPRLTGKERQAATNSHTPSAEAYQLYLKGSYFLDRNDEASIQRAREYFHQAIEKDPGYALAYTGLADSHKDNPDEASAPAAKAAVMKALEIDSSLGEAHISLAGILWHRDWNFADAEQEFDRGLELNPSYATAHHEYSHYSMTMGRVEKSLAESERYLDLDPLSPAANVHMGWHYLTVRQYDQAIGWEQKALAMDTNFRNARFQLGEAYYYKGMYDEAVEEYLKAAGASGAAPELIASMREAYKRSGIRGFLKRWLNDEKESEQRLVPYFPRSQLIAKLYGRLGAKEQALEWLVRAVEKRDMFVDHFCTEPELDSLRSDARFIALVRRIGLRP